MPKITVWECPHTGNMFRNYTDYRNHLRRLSTRRRAAMREENRIRERDEHLATIRNCTSLDEIASWIVTNCDGDLKQVIFFTDSDTGVNKLWWGDRLPNSHNSPKGRPTNFRANNDRASSYPGWFGHIRLFFNNKNDRFSTDNLKLVGINTGSGGRSTLTSEYDVKLFAEDFPGLVYGLGAKPVFKPYGPCGEIIRYEDDERFVCLNRMFLCDGKLLRPDVRLYLETSFGRERNDRKPGEPYDDWSFHYHHNDWSFNDKKYVEFRSVEQAEKFKSRFSLEYKINTIIEPFLNRPTRLLDIADPSGLINDYRDGKVITLEFQGKNSLEYLAFDNDHDLTLYLLAHQKPSDVLRIV